MAVAWTPNGLLKRNTQAGNPRKNRRYFEQTIGGSKYHTYAGGPNIKVVPKKKAAAASLPAADAAPTSDPTAPLLPDSLYTGELGKNQFDYDTASNDFTAQENRLGLDAGIDFTRGADGGIGSYGISENVDVTNPFSQAALLKKSFQDRSRGTQNSYAAQGQLYAGSLQNAQGDNAFENQKAQDSLFKTFQDNFLNIGRGRSAAKSALEGGNLDALGGLLDRRSQEAPVDSGPAPAASAGKPKSGYAFVQDSGTRKGLSYKIVKRGAKSYRYYENGDVVAR